MVRGARVQIREIRMLRSKERWLQGIIKETREGRLKRIHINQHVIRRNVKNNTDEPPITVKCGSENHYGSEAEIQGPSELVYSPHKPLLSCGARLVLATRAVVVVKTKEGETVIQ